VFLFLVGLALKFHFRSKLSAVAAMKEMNFDVCTFDLSCRFVFCFDFFSCVDLSGILRACRRC
jgi:hypothetical protein